MALENTFKQYSSNGDLNPFWVNREEEIHNIKSQVEAQKYMQEELGGSLDGNLALLELQYKAMALGDLEGKLEFLNRYHEDPGLFKLCCKILNIDISSLLDEDDSD